MPPRLLQKCTNASTDPSIPAVGTATTPDLSEMTPTVMVVSVTPFSVAPRAGLARLHDGVSVPTFVSPAALDVAPPLDGVRAAPTSSPGGGPLSRDPHAAAT